MRGALSSCVDKAPGSVTATWRPFSCISELARILLQRGPVEAQAAL